MSSDTMGKSLLCGMQALPVEKKGRTLSSLEGRSRERKDPSPTGKSFDWCEGAKLLEVGEDGRGGGKQDGHRSVVWKRAREGGNGQVTYLCEYRVSDWGEVEGGIATG